MHHLMHAKTAQQKMAMADPVPEHDLEESTLYIEPFVGWRAWAIVINDEADQVLLRSITYKIPWPPNQELQADCLASATPFFKVPMSHPSPNPQHSCGIHAVKKRDDALVWMNAGFYVTKPELRCVGEVKLWGAVYKYTEGFLAQFAYPSKVWVDPQEPQNFPISSREAVHELRRTYKGVEVRLM